ncbi:MAG: putative sulfoacetate transporter SauU [Syntrophorhabdaceae bacterium PtaU1.Bin034]|nr:MAG: putative sulfoacetate transporter SauU [Syntrophorhabdaceae bacterium PtaU1.Bin034]
MEEKSVYSSYRWLMMLVTALAIMAIYIDMIAIAPILGDVAKGLQVDMGAATNLMMGFVLATACVLIWGGVVCDKYGITAALVLGLLCATVPATFMPWIGTSYGAVIVARLVQGASIGFIFAVIGPVLALWFPPKEQGIAGGIMLAFISVGSALGGLISPMIFSSGVSWQATVSILSLLGWVVIVLALLITRRPPNPEVVKGLMEVMQASAGQLSFGKALALGMTWIGSFVVFFNTWNLYVFLNLIPPYIAAPAPMGVGLGPVTAGKLALAGTIVGIIATLLGGAFFDKVAKGRQRPAVVIGFLLTAIFAFPLALPAVYSNMGLFVVCLILCGFGFNFMSASLSGFIAMNYPPSIVGRMVGWWFGFGTFGGALGLFIGGATIGATGSFKTAIILLSVSAVIGLILDFFLQPIKK